MKAVVGVLSKTTTLFLGVTLLILCACSSHSRATANYVPIEASKVNDIVLGRHIYMLEDPSGTLLLDDVKTGNLQQQFEPVFSESPYLGRTHSTYWFRFQLEFKPDNSPLLLEISYPHLSDVTLFQVNENKLLSRIHSGYGQPDRAINCSRICFLIQPQVGLNTIYLKVASDSPVFVPMNLRAPEAQLEHERFLMALAAVFYGAFVVMSLFNFFLYWSTRESSYLYYVFYISVLCLWTLSHDGLLRELVLFRSDWLASYKTHFILTLLSTTMGGLFCQNFLKTREFMPTLHKLFGFLILVSAANIALIIVTGRILLPNSANLLTLFMSGIALCAGIVGLMKGFKTARFFLIAWICVIVGAMSWILTISGVFPLNLLTSFSVQLGGVLECILLALALGDRINVLQAERIEIERNANKKLEESNRKLAASNRFKDEFLSTVSHELRTPMNGIFGASELLEHTSLDATQIKYLATISRSSRDMMAMVENILTYTQLESGVAAADNHSFRVRESLEELAAHYRGRAAIQGLEFHFYLDSSIPASLSGDEDKLKLLLDHLLDNAFKFTDQGSIHFNINAERMENRDSLMLRFSIRDSGCGVPESLQAEIFDSFKQADGSLTRRKGGLGIGLALSSKIVHILGGTMHFQSTVGLGTEVTLSLPFQPSHAIEVQPLDSISDRIQPGNRDILVVEDNYVNKLVMEGQLKMLGFQVSSANNGKEAVSMMTRQMYDLVFMDCQMPIMDGFEATRLIRQLDNKNAKIPIIAVTANTNLGDRESCLEVGMNDYIKKPFNRASLINAINRWLDRDNAQI